MTEKEEILKLKKTSRNFKGILPKHFRGKPKYQDRKSQPFSKLRECDEKFC